mmetsp:Transcript_81680/g.136707  ORF Transcript_81680/g.136707 Transcript_81680/m.136707 type:complete len:240 (-) Transcript_81680:825-1544(-)
MLYLEGTYGTRRSRHSSQNAQCTFMTCRTKLGPRCCAVAQCQGGSACFKGRWWAGSGLFLGAISCRRTLPSMRTPMKKSRQHIRRAKILMDQLSTTACGRWILTHSDGAKLRVSMRHCPAFAIPLRASGRSVWYSGAAVTALPHTMTCTSLTSARSYPPPIPRTPALPLWSTGCLCTRSASPHRSVMATQWSVLGTSLLCLAAANSPPRRITTICTASGWILTCKSSLPQIRCLRILGT